MVRISPRRLALCRKFNGLLPVGPVRVGWQYALFAPAAAGGSIREREQD
ncbi:hypothetical protein COLO4_27075 [Corchorus olitorius]|uniref:Uncharacterized protein n=1 Tax=Corchorus olitorius TaxID=93759 RepID=A0A1R3HTJ2_9ROSI|nr:hypothetical protein COLO4_27075 [Corchorus olitorius]